MRTNYSTNSTILDNDMKKFFLLIAILGIAITTDAAKKDEATRKVLDSAAAHLKSAGGIKTMFTATSLIGKQVQGSTNGTMYLKGNKFQMTTPAILTWFDGKTMWSMQQGDNEVTMTEPTGEELQDVNPYAFLAIYKKGFNYHMKKGKLINGKQGYKIYMTADNAAQEIREIYIEIDNNYNPVRVSARRGKDEWSRVVLNDFSTGEKLSDADFTFPKADYPKALIIDLR